MVVQIVPVLRALKYAPLALATLQKLSKVCNNRFWILRFQRARKLAARGGHICKNYLILSIFEQIVIGQLNIVMWRLQDAYLRVRSAGTIRAITSLPWMLQCQRSVIIKVLDPPISNENRAHWGMNHSKWSINYETFPSHKGRKLLAS